MMYSEYFYLEQWYRWLRDVFPLIVIGFVLFISALCCAGSIMFESKKGIEENE